MKPVSSVTTTPVYPDLVKLAGRTEPVVHLALEKLAAGKVAQALHLMDSLRRLSISGITAKTSSKTVGWRTE